AAEPRRTSPAPSQSVVTGPREHPRHTTPTRDVRHMLTLSALLTEPSRRWLPWWAIRQWEAPRDSDRLLHAHCCPGDDALRGGIQRLLDVGEPEFGVDQFVERVRRLVSLYELQRLTEVAGFVAFDVFDGQRLAGDVSRIERHRATGRKGAHDEVAAPTSDELESFSEGGRNTGHFDAHVRPFAAEHVMDRGEAVRRFGHGGDVDDIGRAECLRLLEAGGNSVDDDDPGAALDRDSSGVEAQPTGSLDQDGLTVFEPDLVDAEHHLGQRAIDGGRNGVIDIVRDLVEVLVRMDVVVGTEGGVEMRPLLGLFAEEFVGVVTQAGLSAPATVAALAGLEIRHHHPVAD